MLNDFPAGSKKVKEAYRWVYGKWFIKETTDISKSLFC